MEDKPPRWVPRLSAAVHLGIAACIIIFWPPEPHTLAYWVRGAIFTLMAYWGLQALWHGFFVSDARVRELVDGDLHGKNSN